MEQIQLDQIFPENAHEWTVMGLGTYDKQYAAVLVQCPGCRQRRWWTVLRESCEELIQESDPDGETANNLFPDDDDEGSSSLPPA